MNHFSNNLNGPGKEQRALWLRQNAGVGACRRGNLPRTGLCASQGDANTLALDPDGWLNGFLGLELRNRTTIESRIIRFRNPRHLAMANSPKDLRSFGTGSFFPCLFFRTNGCPQIESVQAEDLSLNLPGEAGFAVWGQALELGVRSSMTACLGSSKLRLGPGHGGCEVI